MPIKAWDLKTFLQECKAEKADLESKVFRTGRHCRKVISEA